jgi:cupin fold WbuC family metalloprotein
MRQSDGTLLKAGRMLAADPECVEIMKRHALASPRRTFRVCLHADHGDPVQEMLVASAPAATRPPHCHPGRVETHLVLEGNMTMLLFDRDGALRRRIEMGAMGTGRPFCVRGTPDLWHMAVFRPDCVVYYEISAGPYEEDRALTWAPWAPAPDDPEGIAAFVRELDATSAGPRLQEENG